MLLLHVCDPGLVKRRLMEMHAAVCGDAQLGRLLDGKNLASSIWADAEPRLILRLLHPPVAEFQRRKPRGSQCRHISGAAMAIARVRDKVEHVSLQSAALDHRPVCYDPINDQGLSVPEDRLCAPIGT